MTRGYWWTSLRVHQEIPGSSYTFIFKKYHSPPILTCAFFLWVFHYFCPYMVPRDFFYIGIWALEQNADTERPKMALAAQEIFSHVKFTLHPAHMELFKAIRYLQGQVQSPASSCDGEGEDSQVWKVNMWQWEREERGDLGQRKKKGSVLGWRRAGERNMSCDGKKG